MVSSIIGLMPTENEVEAQRGMAKNGPIVEIKQDGEEVAVAASDPAAHLKKSVTAAHAERRNTQKRNADACYKKAYHGEPYVCTGRLSHKHREYQIPRAEKQAEQHTANGGGLGGRKSFFHNNTYLSL